MGDNDVLKATLGDRGRLVIPAEVRERLRLETGSVLVFRMQDDAVEVITREALLARARAEWAKSPVDAVAELLAERRAEALAELRQDLDGGWRPTSEDIERFRESFGEDWLDVERTHGLSQDGSGRAA